MCILNDCVEQSLESVLILEDDSAFVPGFTARAHHLLASLPADWNYLFLGGQHIHLDRGLPKRVNDCVFRPFNVNRSHAYAVRGLETMRSILRHISVESEWPLPHHIDHRLGALHESQPAGLYVPDKWLVAQGAGRSDIAGKEFATRMFPHSDWIAECRPDKPVLAILGDDGRVFNCLAADDTSESSTIESSQEALERMLIGLLGENTNQGRSAFEVREAHLRMWASSKANAGNSSMGWIIAGHPLLAAIIEEAESAWPAVKWIFVNDPDKWQFRFAESSSIPGAVREQISSVYSQAEERARQHPDKWLSLTPGELEDIIVTRQRIEAFMA